MFGMLLKPIFGPDDKQVKKYNLGGQVEAIANMKIITEVWPYLFLLVTLGGTLHLG